MKGYLIQITLSICFFAVSKQLPAQKNDSLLKELSQKWRNAKLYVLKIAEAMPAENYTFKPVPEIMSFQEQMLHVADNMRWLSATHLFADTTADIRKTGMMDKAAVMKYVADAYDKAWFVHDKLTTPQLDEKVSFFAGPMTRRQIIILMHDHQTHHAGELILYLRLKGIKPPSYVGW